MMEVMDHPVAATMSDGHEMLSSEQLRSLRDEALGDLYFFAKGVLGYKDLCPRIHIPLCRILENQEGKNLQHELIRLPRTWFKSSVCSIAFPIWRACRNPDERVAIVQNTVTNAMKKLHEISQIFMENELFRLLFPDILPTKSCRWTSETMTVNRPGSFPEGTFEGIGVKTQSISRHYTIIIEDDTVAPDFDELGMDNLMPTKDDIGKAIGFHRIVKPYFVDPQKHTHLVVGTRWFQEDLQSYIEKNEPSFRLYERAVTETDGRPDEFGELTWPERFSQEVLDDYRSSMGPYLFSCLYLNKPIASDTQAFQLEWFHYYDTEEQDLIITTTVDPAGDPEDTKGTPDWGVVCTTGKSLSSGAIYVLEITRGKWNPSQQIDAIFQHLIRWKPIKLGIEAVAYQKTLLHWLREAMRKRNHYVVCEGIQNNRRSKNARIMGLQPLVMSGTLKFRHFQQILISELLVFPNGAYDDMADALAMQLEFWPMTRRAEVRELASSRHPLSFDAIMFDLEKRIKEEESHKLVNPVMDVLNKRPAIKWDWSQ